MFLLFVAPICHSKASDIFFSSCIFFSYFQQERRPVVPSLPQMFSWPCRQFCAQFFKNYLTSATFFNVTIICSSNSRASAFFLIYDFFSFSARTTACCANPSANFWRSCRQFFSFSQFLPSFFKKYFHPCNTAGRHVAIFNYWRIFIHMTATVPLTTYHIYLRKHYLISTTFFNVTIVCCTNSRASAIFFSARTTACCANPSANFWWSCPPIFFLQPIFAQFFQNWRKSANWLTICTPEISSISKGKISRN